MENSDKIMTLEEVAEYLRLKPQTIYTWAQTKKIPAAKQNGIWMMTSNLMAIMGRMAAYSGQVVTWEQALNAAEDWTPSAYSMSELEGPPVAVPGAYIVPEPATT